MQPKQYTDPKIALLNIELELKAERDNAEVRLESVEVSTLFNRISRSQNYMFKKMIYRSTKRWLMQNGPFCMTNWKNCI